MIIQDHIRLAPRLYQLYAQVCLAGFHKAARLLVSLREQLEADLFAGYPDYATRFLYFPGLDPVPATKSHIVRSAQSLTERIPQQYQLLYQTILSSLENEE